MGLKDKVIARKDDVIVGAVVLAIGFFGYFDATRINYNLANALKKSNRPIVGTVLKEVYKNTLTPNPERNGVVSYSNETVKLESKYTLKLRTDDGRVLGVSIVDGGDAKKESLDRIINRGTRVSFPAGNLQNTSWYEDHRVARGETYFTRDTQVGTKRADRIRVLGNK